MHGRHTPSNEDPFRNYSQHLVKYQQVSGNECGNIMMRSHADTLPACIFIDECALVSFLVGHRIPLLWQVRLIGACVRAHRTEQIIQTSTQRHFGYVFISVHDRASYSLYFLSIATRIEDLNDAICHLARVVPKATSIKFKPHGH